MHLTPRPAFGQAGAWRWVASVPRRVQVNEAQMAQIFADWFLHDLRASASSAVHFRCGSLAHRPVDHEEQNEATVWGSFGKGWGPSWRLAFLESVRSEALFLEEQNGATVWGSFSKGSGRAELKLGVLRAPPASRQELAGKRRLHAIVLPVRRRRVFLTHPTPGTYLAIRRKPLVFYVCERLAAARLSGLGGTIVPVVVRSIRLGFQRLAAKYFR